MESDCKKDPSKDLQTNGSQNENSSEATLQSTNINISELDEETNNKLKGDVIGDTLYSQSFVLKTLLQFSDLKWNEQVEEDLCFLWDMTVEKDVCRYLFEVSYPSLACSALIKYHENRFVEIVIGILANILCVDSETTLSDDEVNIILQQLESEDPLILVQVMRFISAYAHKSTDLILINEEVMEKIKFILVSSLNNELLVKTLETLVKLTLDNKIQDKLINLELYDICLSTYHNLIQESDSDFSLDDKNQLLICRYMLEIVCNICSYTDRFDNCQLLLDLQRNADKFVKEVIKIIKYFSQEENLFPVTDEFIFFMSTFQYTLVILNINYFSTLFLSFCKILLRITDTKEEYSELFENLLELTIFLLSRGSFQVIKKDFKHFSKQEIKYLLNIVNENQHKYNYDISMSELFSIV